MAATDTGLRLAYRYLDIPIVNWHAPATVTLETTYWKADDPRPRAERPPLLEFRTSHFYTPETEASTNYFWSHFNQAAYGSEEELDKTYKIVERAILGEDMRMIVAQ